MHAIALKAESDRRWCIDAPVLLCSGSQLVRSCALHDIITAHSVMPERKRLFGGTWSAKPSCCFGEAAGETATYHIAE